MNKATAQKHMWEADRERAHIAYRGIGPHLTDAQELRLIEQNCNTPEYRLAEKRFQKYSRIVGNDGPEALKEMFRI